MPAIPPRRIVQTILQAIEASGSHGLLVSGIRGHPRQFRLITEDGQVTIWVYIWTITPGGRDNLPDEYRIQMTTVVPPLPENPSGPTLLLGWYPDLAVFAGFDVSRHRNFRPGSNSVQVSLTALRAARNFSWGFYTNQFGEISVAFRPSEFLNYLRNAEDLHRSGPHAANLLTRVARLDAVNADELEILPAPRRRIVETISRLSRAASFRDQVLAAYDHRCAVTGLQLRLVEAAHILPVVDERSVDLVTNGLALSSTYHRAFDHGLIYLSPDYRMRINQLQINRLQPMNLIGGLNQLRQFMNREIFLPANPGQRPSIAFIRRANLFRHIPD